MEKTLIESESINLDTFFIEITEEFFLLPIKVACEIINRCKWDGIEFRVKHL